MQIKKSMTKTATGESAASSGDAGPGDLVFRDNRSLVSA